ncbi:MAG: glycoside hydrolase family 3 protein, partial [Planctomycetota bacterium]
EQEKIKREILDLARRIQGACRVPPLLTADLEGGAGQVFGGATRFPRPMGLAATGDESIVAEVARMTAAEARAIGVHVCFQPVVDVNVNPRNPIINVRSFGEDPAEVARLGAITIRALQAHGVIATAKHFPGHGDTEIDSHLALPVVRASRARLDRVELPPFVAAVESGVGAVMSAHIAWPEVSAEPGLPATLDRSVLHGILREEMGFEGIIFTDALTMGGITEHCSPEEAAMRALLAGADALLHVDVETLLPELARGARAGRIPAALVERSAGRILAAKESLGLHQAARGERPTPAGPIATREAATIAGEAVRRSITLIRDRRGEIPMRAPGRRRLLQVLVVDPGQDSWGFTPGERLATTLRERGATVETVPIDAGGDGLADALGRGREVDAVVVTAYSGVAAFRGSSGLSPRQLEALGTLGRAGAILIAMGNPYALSGLGDFSAVLLAYDTCERTDRLAAGALLGDFTPTGTLPVTIPGLADRGAGRR